MSVQGLVRVSTGFGASPKRLFEMVTTSDQTTFEAAGVTRSELPAGTRDTDLITVYGNGFTQTYQANISNAGDVTLTQAHGVGTGSTGSGATTFAALTDIPANAAGALTNDGSGNLTWSPAGAGYTDAQAVSAVTAAGINYTDAKVDARIALQTFYTTADFTTDFAAESTTNLTEGTNLYFTDARADARIAAFFPADAPGSLTNDGAGNLSWVVGAAGYTTTDFTNDLTATDTDALSEGTTNLYYTDARFDAQFMLSSILGLSDTPLAFGAAGTVLKVDAAGTALEFGSASDGPTAVNSLADIPDPTTLQAGETYLVANDATPALNGLYQVDGTIPGAGVGVSRVPA